MRRGITSSAGRSRSDPNGKPKALPGNRRRLLFVAVRERMIDRRSSMVDRDNGGRNQKPSLGGRCQRQLTDEGGSEARSVPHPSFLPCGRNATFPQGKASGGERYKKPSPGGRWRRRRRMRATDEGQSIGGGCIEKVFFPHQQRLRRRDRSAAIRNPEVFIDLRLAPPDIPSARKGREENKRETRGINGSPMQGASLERGTRPKGGLS